MANELTVYNFEETKGLADAFAKSGMFTDIKSMAQAIVKVQAGKELGLSPVYAMQNINMIRGRLCTSANTLALLVKRSGKYDYKVLENTDTKCSIEFYQNGKPVGISTFTIEDAKRAELVRPDSGWVKYPRAMLFSRAISQGARIYCPDAIGGAYTEEEMRAVEVAEQPHYQPVNETESDNVVAEVYESVQDNNIGEEIGEVIEEPTQPTEAPITEPQRRKIYAASKQMGYTTQQVEDLIVMAFGKLMKTSELTKKQGIKLIEMIEQGIGLDDVDGTSAE